MLESIHLLKYSCFIADDYDYWIGLFKVSEDNWIWIVDNSSLSSTGYEVWATGKASVRVNSNCF